MFCITLIHYFSCLFDVGWLNRWHPYMWWKMSRERVSIFSTAATERPLTTDCFSATAQLATGLKEKHESDEPRLENMS